MKRLFLLLITAALLLCSCAPATQSAPTRPAAEPTQAAATEPQTQPPTEPPTDPPSVGDLAKVRLKEILKTDGKEISPRANVAVDIIYQNPELPAGCEAVALTIALNSFGCGLDKTEIASKYLVHSDDWITGYQGDPFRWGGAGTAPPGLVKTANAFIKAKGADLYPLDTTGTKLSDLYKLIDSGSPVVIWTTYYMGWPQLQYKREYKGHSYAWYDNEHCVCMYGYDKKEGTVKIADPLRGKITLSAYDFERIYDEIGRLSMTIISTKELK